MWSSSPTGDALSSAHLDILEASLPSSQPCVWRVERGAEPVLEVVIYEDNGDLREIQQMPAARWAPRASVTSERYAAFVRAAARAFADPMTRDNAFMTRVLDAEELVTEDDFHLVLTDDAARARRVYPTWARVIASGAGLPDPDAATAQVVGALADCWSGSVDAFAHIDAAVAHHDTRSGPYLIGLVEALAAEREAAGGPIRSDDVGRDVDVRLLAATLPLLELAPDADLGPRIARLGRLVEQLAEE